ncbi:hypothetical protein OHA72_12225 [Dactylosporangium sp. NBC_01737]|uniref:hypothetical protein n=1 Tax=Dactylosporangium sp. NBC_01737 TaxID=2975959 RepID=UPI002E11981B|nr:hypothetical protein OHA72_12225 [Dactylosporangium sp. NBC_01737]
MAAGAGLAMTPQAAAPAPTRTAAGVVLTVSLGPTRTATINASEAGIDQVPWMINLDKIAALPAVTKYRLAAACRTGEVIAIETVLDPDAAAVCDGGGRVPAPIGPVHGAAEVAPLLCALLPGTDLTIESINGRAGLAIRRAGTAVAVIAVSCDEDRATTLCVVLNPAKLRGWHRR